MSLIGQVALSSVKRPMILNVLICSLSTLNIIAVVSDYFFFLFFVVEEALENKEIGEN